VCYNGGAHTVVAQPHFLSIGRFNKFLMQFLCNLLFDNYPKIVYYYYINKREVINMKDYRVYFRDGDIKIYSTQYGMFSLITHLVFELNYSQTDFIKIEEINS